MKRVFCLVFAICLMFTFTIQAFADGTDGNFGETPVNEQPSESDTFTPPDKENNTFPFEITDGKIFDIKPNTSVSDLKKAIFDSYDTIKKSEISLKVLNAKREEKEDKKRVSTGDLIVFTQKESADAEYKVIILGDTNCDGAVTAADITLLKKLVLFSQNIYEDVMLAGSISRSGKISAADIIKIKKAVLFGIYDLINDKSLPCTHSNMLPADCTHPKRCPVCGYTEGEPLGHDMADADCEHPRHCTRCDYTEGEALGHDYTEADCEHDAVCRRCGHIGQKALGHDFLGATIHRPKTCARCGLTVGDKLPENNVNSLIRTQRDENPERNKFIISGTDYVPPDDILQKFNDKISQTKGEVAFYIYDLDSYAAFGCNIDKRFNAACVVKAAYCLYVMQQIDSGNGSLDEEMVFLKKHYYPKSGSIKESPFGTIFSMRDVLRKTIGESDNCGYYMLVDRFGKKGYNAWLDEIGVKYLHLLRESSNWTDVCAADLALIWNEIYKYRQTDTYNARFLFNNFIYAQHNYLKVQLPGYTIAHKSGWTETVFNDAGIVLEHESPYIVAILTYDTEGLILCPTARYADELMTDYYRRN